MTAQRTIAHAWGLFLALLLLLLGRGLIGVLVGVRAELEGFSTGTIGMITGSFFVGFLVGAHQTPRLMARVGHIRVFSGLTALVGAAILAHAVSVEPLPWVALGIVVGIAMAGLYVVAESWLNEAADNTNRGRIMGAYMIVSMGGLALGQMLLGAGDPGDTTLFIVAGALVVLAIVPVTLSFGTAPPFELPPRMLSGDIWRVAPLGVVGAFFGGVANGAVLGMAGVYAIQVGMSTVRAGVFVAAASVGAVLLQWPIGLLSDRIGRRPAIMIFSAGAAVVGVLALGLDPVGSPTMVAMAFFGGFSFSMYSLSLSHVVDVLPRGQAVQASVAIVFVTGVGSVLGPIGSSLAMTAFGPNGLWWTVIVVHAAIGAYAVVRVVRRPVIEGITIEPYMAVPARSTGVVRLVRNSMRRNGATPAAE